MRKFALQCIAASLVLAASAAVQAKDDHARRGCSLDSLKGLYVFTATGYTVAGGVALPKAVVQFTRFNGNGTFTVPAGTLSANGAITQIPPTVVGTYTLGRDCTGAYQFGPAGGPTFDLFVAPDGDGYWLIQTGPGAQVQQGAGERLSR